MRIKAVSSVKIILFSMIHIMYSSDGCAADKRWIDVKSVGEEILENKIDIDLDNTSATNIFKGFYPKVNSKWKEFVKSGIQMAPDAQYLPNGQKFLKIMRKREGEPLARVARYSYDEVIVKIIRPVGSYLWHHYYHCIASFRINRTNEIDMIMRINELDETYGRKHKGIQQGDGALKVIDILGEPSGKRGTQAMGHSYWYDNEMIVIEFINSRVHKFETTNFKEEVKY